MVQSRQNSALGLQVKVLKPFEGVPLHFGRDSVDPIGHSLVSSGAILGSKAISDGSSAADGINFGCRDPHG